MTINNTLVISDIHLSVNNVKSFYSVFLPLLGRFVKEYHFDSVIFLGDVFDGDINKVVLILFKDILKILSGKKIFFVAGNHDYINKQETIYDLIIHNDSIKVIKSYFILENFVFVPYIKKCDDLKKVILSSINSISDYNEIFLFTHNDFSEIYSHTNNFLKLKDINIDKRNVVIFNGHNHRPFFRISENITLCNLGCAINLSYQDGCHDNIFAFIEKKSKSNVKFICNSSSYKFYTFVVNNDFDFDYMFDVLNNNNIKYVKFLIRNVNITITNDIIHKLKSDYNVYDIKFEYNMNIKHFESIDDNTNEDIENLTKVLDLNYDDFYENDMDKLCILNYLLDSYIKDNQLKNEEVDELKNVIYKYYTSRLNKITKDTNDNELNTTI